MHGHAIRSQDIRGVQIILTRYCIQRKYMGKQKPAWITSLMVYAITSYCHIISTDHVCGDPLWQGIPRRTFRNVLKTPIDSHLGKSHGLLLWIRVYILLSTANSLSHWSSPRTPKLIYTLIYAHRGLPIYRNPPYQ